MPAGRLGSGMTLGFTGAIIAPPIFGATVDATDSYPLAWTMTAGVVRDRCGRRECPGSGSPDRRSCSPPDPHERPSGTARPIAATANASHGTPASSRVPPIRPPTANDPRRRVLNTASPTALCPAARVAESGERRRQERPGAETQHDQRGHRDPPCRERCDRKGGEPDDASGDAPAEPSPIGHVVTATRDRAHRRHRQGHRHQHDACLRAGQHAADDQPGRHGHLDEAVRDHLESGPEGGQAGVGVAQPSAQLRRCRRSADPPGAP